MAMATAAPGTSNASMAVANQRSKALIENDLRAGRTADIGRIAYSEQTRF